ncbi:MAG: polyprenyl synthetase family protein [Bacteroidia bacterium]|nr:polyprenyl synthetase family protein [Bacteroidia bacterium]
MLSFKELFDQFANYLERFRLSEQPKTLYDPVNYILSLGGKRIRPLLTLAAYNLYDADISKAMNAGMAIEMFHNFSLLHDDIMDDADMRRGKPSVHIKYDPNAAILSGDVMMILSYKLLESYGEKVQSLYQEFTKTAIEVCEGQRYDMDFEVSSKVSIKEYIEMITLKTSVLLGAAMKMGAIIGEASVQDQFHLYEFGKNLGIAFQIQDDVLDTFGNEETFGKKIGGDIIQKKKTFLYLKTLELLSEEEAKELRSLFAAEYVINDDQKHIDQVKELYKKAHVLVHADETKLVYKQLASSHLEAVSVDASKIEVLKVFADKLLNRNV